MPGFYTPTIFGAIEGLVAGESRRTGGFSAPPYASLNLSFFTEDDHATVALNRQAFFGALGFSEGTVAWTHQVHGAEVALVESPTVLQGYDALISKTKGVLLAISVADCTPILIYDPVHQAIGAAHAGWRGTVGAIVRKTLAMMQQQFGTIPADCRAFVGTCIDQDSFEVDADVADHFSAEFKYWDPAKRKFFVDLKAANQTQLLQAGLPEAQVEVSPFSTYLRNDLYFSHRKEKGVTGRMLAVIGLK